MELALALSDIFLNRMRIVNVGAFRRIFNITREDGVSNWFSSVQMLVVGGCVWLVFLWSKTDGRPRRTQLGWAAIASFFTYVAFDDATKFHERMGTTFRVLSENGGSGLFDAFPSYAWQVVFGPFFLFLGGYVLWFLWRELAEYHSWILTAFGCFVVAVGLDFVEGLEGHPYHSLAAFLSVRHSVIIHYSKLVEEIIEMLGTTTFLFIFLSKIDDVYAGKRIQIS